jgi:hypothetical protein
MVNDSQMACLMLCYRGKRLACPYAAAPEESKMDVLRQGREWRMRWLTTAATTSVVSAASDGAALEDLCARCDDGGMWIAVSDLPSMPLPSVIYDCPCCGRTTAHAELRVTMRSIGD